MTLQVRLQICTCHPPGMAPTGGKGPFEEQGGGRRGKASIEGEFLTDDLNIFLGGRGGGSV